MLTDKRLNADSKMNPFDKILKVLLFFINNQFVFGAQNWPAPENKILVLAKIYIAGNTLQQK